MSIPIKLRWLFVFFSLSACMDRIYFDVGPAQSLTVIEGFISDVPGPYTVNVSYGLDLDDDSTVTAPLEKVKIKLYDDEGNVEDFTESSPGEYKTAGLIQGKLGHAYSIHVETPDGRIFESDPDRMGPGGEVDTIRYTFEARTVTESYGEVAADVFNVFVDAHAGEGQGEDKYVRWRYTGTYKVVTHPELKEIWSQGFILKDPYPCSGWQVAPGPPGSGGTLGPIDGVECTCCTCWVKQYEPVPQLSDVQLISGNRFNNVKVGEVPINKATFFDKYLVEVEQMSVSATAFNFFKLIRTQKESASSLFQPISGEIRGNVKAVNSSAPVVGLFWATSIKKKSLFINRSDVPYLLTPNVVSEPCNTWYPNSSTEKPPYWP